MRPIPHDFTDPALRELALTHSSTGRARDNERLEFLGDAVLDLVIAEELYRDHPNLSEGALTEFKAEIVSRKTLAEAARELELESHVTVGPGLKGRTLPRSVQANLYEAVLGAVYLDAGLEVSRTFVLETLAEPLARAGTEELPDNPKQELQQTTQRRWGAPPIYRVAEKAGRSHARAFLVIAEAGGIEFPGAWGRTVKEAERWAAHEALLVIEGKGDAG
jgi:ribonuclease III